MDFLRRTGSRSQFVGAAHILKYGLALLINEASKQLLRIPEHERPSKNLGGGVECAKPWHELATDERQTQERSDSTSR
jgi:hypothetical protein